MPSLKALISASRTGFRVEVVGGPIRTDAYAMESAMEIIVGKGGAERLAWMLPWKPDKQSANPFVDGSMVQRT